MKKLIGLLCTASGGGLLGAGIQRTYLMGNKISSSLSKLLGNTQYKFDEKTWIFFIGGFLLLCFGVYFSTRKR